MVKIITRAQWGARAPKRTPVGISEPTPDLWIHHTADELHGASGVRAAQAFHMDSRGWSDIGYSFLVDDDGLVYEGRGFGIAGGHTEGHNFTSHAISFMGNFDNRRPTPAALTAGAELVRLGATGGHWRGITGGHRDASGASTACPGRYLEAELPWLRTASTSTNPPTSGGFTVLDPQTKAYMDAKFIRLVLEERRTRQLVLSSLRVKSRRTRQLLADLGEQITQLEADLAAAEAVR